MPPPPRRSDHAGLLIIPHGVVSAVREHAASGTTRRCIGTWQQPGWRARALRAQPPFCTGTGGPGWHMQPGSLHADRARFNHTTPQHARATSNRRWPSATRLWIIIGIIMLSPPPSATSPGGGGGVPVCHVHGCTLHPLPRNLNRVVLRERQHPFSLRARRRLPLPQTASKRAVRPQVHGHRHRGTESCAGHRRPRKHRSLSFRAGQRDGGYAPELHTPAPPPHWLAGRCVANGGSLTCHGMPADAHARRRPGAGRGGQSVQHLQSWTPPLHVATTSAAANTTHQQ